MPKPLVATSNTPRKLKCARPSKRQQRPYILPTSVEFLRVFDEAKALLADKERGSDGQLVKRGRPRKVKNDNDT